MKNKSKILKTVALIVVAIAIIVIMVIRLKKNKETTKNRVYQFNKEQVLNVQGEKIHGESLKNEYYYTGTFEPNKESKISAEIQGRINSVLVDIGSIVRKGQALIQLDNSILKLQLQSVEIQIEGLEADVKRFTILANADAIQGVQLEKTILSLKSAKVQKATILEQIKKTIILAPFDGVVTAKLSEEGVYAGLGVPLLQITDISTLRFTINVPEQELSQFELTQAYAITADAFSTTLLSGKIIMKGSKANVGNSFPIQFVVKNTSDLKIKSGMFGKVTPSVVDEKFKNNEAQIVILASAIVGTAIHPQVYVVKNGKAVLQNVVISSRFQNKAVISSGLSEGDMLITNGFVNLFDGANVNIK